MEDGRESPSRLVQTQCIAVMTTDLTMFTARGLRYEQGRRGGGG